MRWASYRLVITCVIGLMRISRPKIGRVYNIPIVPHQKNMRKGEGLICERQTRTNSFKHFGSVVWTQRVIVVGGLGRYMNSQP